MKKPPSVSVPARICRAPTYITDAPTSPRSSVEDRPMTEVEVRVFSTFVSRRPTPVPNTSASRDSAW